MRNVGAFILFCAVLAGAQISGGGGGGGTPGGTNTQIQYNNSGVFGGLTAGGTCTNQVATAISTAIVPTCTTVTSAYTSGTFSATAHNLLSATHGDTTAAAAVRGGGIFATGGTPLWTQVAHSATTGGYFKWNGTDIVASTGAASGTGSSSKQVVSALNADAAPTFVYYAAPITFSLLASGFAQACSVGGSTTFAGVTGNGSATEANVGRMVAPFAGTIDTLYVHTSAIPASETEVLAISINASVTSAPTCSISAAGTSCNDTSTSIAVSAGDLIALKGTCSGGSTSLTTVNATVMIH